LTVTPVNPNNIKLHWQDNSNNETGFEVNNGVVSKRVGANTATYTWGGLAPGTYMCFRVRAYNSTGASAWDPNVSPWYLCTTTPPYVQQTSYAGYSAHPSQGNVSFALANWTVPAVISCKPSSFSTRYEAQMSVWAGLWGGPNTGTGIANAWLPQAGTVSGCVRYLGVQVNSYEAVFEMYNAKNSAQGYKVLFNVNAGDHMFAQVEYAGLGAGSHAGELRFWYDVGDLTSGTSASDYFYTTITGVPLAAAAYQGGVIVERVSGPNISGDLPKFAKVNISNVGVGQDPFNPNTMWTVYRWDMKQPGSNGKVYATTGLVSNFPVPEGHGSFSVTWINY
jgi:hypothetical protein